MTTTEEILYKRATTLDVPNCYGNLKRDCKCPIQDQCLRETYERDMRR